MWIKVSIVLFLWALLVGVEVIFPTYESPSGLQLVAVKILFFSCAAAFFLMTAPVLLIIRVILAGTVMLVGIILISWVLRHNHD
jgi:hypothetical protein